VYGFTVPFTTHIVSEVRVDIILQKGLTAFALPAHYRDIAELTSCHAMMASVRKQHRAVSRAFCQSGREALCCTMLHHWTFAMQVAHWRMQAILAQEGRTSFQNRVQLSLASLRLRGSTL
jgi:hypothetical protein